MLLKKIWPFSKLTYFSVKKPSTFTCQKEFNKSSNEKNLNYTNVK